MVLKRVTELDYVQVKEKKYVLKCDLMLSCTYSVVQSISFVTSIQHIP